VRGKATLAKKEPREKKWRSETHTFRREKDWSVGENLSTFGAIIGNEKVSRGKKRRFEASKRKERSAPPEKLHHRRGRPERPDTKIKVDLQEA